MDGKDALKESKRLWKKLFLGNSFENPAHISFFFNSIAISPPPEFL